MLTVQYAGHDNYELVRLEKDDIPSMRSPVTLDQSAEVQNTHLERGRNSSMYVS